MRVRALIGLVVLISVTSTLTAPLTARPLPEPPHEPPFVASVSPNTGRIEGGDVVRLTGYGFTSPVRVFFRSADLRKEAFVISVTPSQIQIVTSQLLFAPSMQHASADIDVVIGAGTPPETLIHAGTSFTFLADSLTPSIIAV